MDQRMDEQISALYTEMFDYMFSYALPALGSPGLAEEAVQETFVIACQKPDKLLNSPNPKGWLVLTLKNVVHNQLRSRARLSYYIMKYAENRALVFNNEEAACDDYTAIEYSDIVSPKDFAMLRMYVFDKCSMLEISKKYGISVDATNKRIQRARSKLKLVEEETQKIV